MRMGFGTTTGSASGSGMPPEESLVGRRRLQAMFAALSLGRSWSARSTESVRTWPLSSRTVIAKPDALDWIFTIGPLLGAAAMGVSR
jgi:hypothetical protein